MGIQSPQLIAIQYPGRPPLDRAMLRGLLPLIYLTLSACAAIPMTNDGRWHALKGELPELTDSKTKRLISEYKSVRSNSPEGEKLAQEIADRGSTNVVLEMARLAGKRTVVPFFPPGPTWEAMFFWKEHPYEFHARSVIEKLRDPQAVPALRVLINHDILPGAAIQALWSMHMDLRPNELEGIFRQTYLHDWARTIPTIERLPKDDAARIFLLYIDPGFIRDQESPASIAGLFDCQNRTLPNVGEPAIRNDVPLSDLSFDRLRLVLGALKKIKTPSTETCISSRRVAIRSALASLDKSQERAELENSANSPAAGGDAAIKAHDQLARLLADIEAQ